jgi:phasin family protein
MFSKPFENFQSLPDPMIKANKAYVANVERLVKFQMLTLRYYVDLTMARLKAAVQVNSLEGAQDFLNGQLEVFGTVRRRMMDDAKDLAELNVEFKHEFENLAREGVAEMSTKAA